MAIEFLMDRWVISAKANPAARLRLICFPHAGGGARMFVPWERRLPADVEVLGVQPPGREERLRELPFTRLQPLVEAIVPALLPYLDLPYVLFGHSLGALVAFEVARSLRRQQPPGPVRLIVSGKAAPQTPSHEPPMHPLPDPEFRDRLRELQGTPPEILINEELMRILLPLLRADFAVSETYLYPGGELLDCPLSAFGGTDDPMVDGAKLEAWRAQTSGTFATRLFPGGHFYLKSSEAFFIALSEELALGTVSQEWSHPPDDLRIQAGEVHLWRANLDLPAAGLDQVAHSLSQEEQERAAGFYFERDRDHFRASHGILRAILGRYLGLPPAQVAYRPGPAGKPELLAPQGPPLEFNLSHSHSLAVIGVTLSRQIGVDVERIRPLPDALQLAERYFSQKERQVLREMSAQERERAFFHCWTRKEAYMKARGLGLSLGLDRFEVAFAPHEPARLLWVEGEHNEPGRWWMTALDCGPDYTAACVVEHGPCKVHLWDWRGTP